MRNGLMMRLLSKYKPMFSEETYVKLVFREILGRNPDLVALKYFSKKLRSGHNLCSIIDEIYSSAESVEKKIRPKLEAEQEEIQHEDGAIQIPHNSKTRINLLNKEKNYKILLFKIDNIGDFITSLGAFSLIRNAFSLSHITLICQETCVSLAESTGIFNEVLPFSLIKSYMDGSSPAPSDDKKNILSQRHFDIVVDYHQHGDMRKFIGIIKSTFKIGYESKYPIGDYNIIFPVPLARENDYNIAMNNTLHLSHNVINYFTINDTVDNLIASKNLPILDAYPIDPETITIVLQPFASTSIKAWPLENYITICEWIAANYNCQILVIGIEADIEDYSMLNELIKIKSVTSLIGKTSLGDAASIIKGASLYIGNDTGLTHVAAHLYVPTIAIMSGCESVHQFAPHLPSVDLIYYKTVCSPCHLNRLDLCSEEHICLRKISVETLKKIISARINNITSKAISQN